MTKTRKPIDFIGKGKIFLIISVSLIAISLLASLFGVDVAIEFKGGTIISYSYTGDIDSAKIKESVQKVVDTPITVQQGDNLDGNTKSVTISFSSNEGLTADKQAQITDALKAAYPDNGIKILDSNDVNPSSGKTFFTKCIAAVAFATIILVVYIAWRFKRISGWSAGVCAIIALFHDVIIVYGTFVLFRFEINANFIAVVLTILGYSVNDTIVIYDRIRENKKLMPRANLRELVNTSLNQSFTRSIRTSLTTVSSMVVVSIVAFINGVDSILSFSVPLIFGMISGAYSSICVASLIWVWWKERRGEDKVTAKKK